MGEGEGGQVPGAGPRVRGPAQLPGLKSWVMIGMDRSGALRKSQD